MGLFRSAGSWPDSASENYARTRIPTHIYTQIPVLEAFHASDPHLVPAEFITGSQTHSEGSKLSF